MARSNHGHIQLPEMDHIQPINVPHNESLPLGQKLLVHHDAPLRIGHSSHGNVTVRSNDLPSSGHPMQTLGYRVGNPGTSHAPFVHYPAGSSSSHLAEPAVSYPHRSEEGFAPVSSHMENRRAAVKRKNPIINPVGISANGYYVGSSSNTQLSNSVQPNPAPLADPFLPQMPLRIGQSGWNGQHLIQQEGFQRNVRARHNHNISLEARPAPAYTANTIHLPSFSSAASAVSLGTSVERNQAPVSAPARTVPSGLASRALERTYYPAIGSSNPSVGAVPTVPSSSSATFANGGYAPRTVHGGAVHVYPHPAPAASSGPRALPVETVIRSYPPAISAATSTSVRMEPSPARSAASSRHSRHIAVGHASNGRNRRARSSYYGFHPLMTEAERFMMLDQLVFYESRAAAADPHRDMRLDIDNMSYEDLLALGEFMGNVNTGLADEKISKCVREVVCCSSDQMQNDQEDQDDGSCVICLEDYKDKDVLGILKCNHDFHADCIKKWLQTKNSCPVCKAAAA
ncbi:hypothetical protein PVAP13_5KG080500 [Panicum virgatum]|uniref:RING-type E3 ubiquitin transferase n=1 Tax=Panicum virgatum TaxID=38727 RepID=A0A8T0SBB1_PANVG|nr:hypothetical protein PVAP13_5KG080500 [Panicum virgatum]